MTDSNGKPNYGLKVLVNPPVSHAIERSKSEKSASGLDAADIEIEWVICP